jgi:uncharacterized protein (DUF2147 family)
MRYATLAFATLSGLTLLTPAKSADGIITSYGTWARSDGDSKVRIAPCGRAICATNIWIRDPGSSEKVGDILEIKLSGEGSVFKGTAYDKQRNLTLTFEMNISKNSLTTKGCVLGGIICKTAAWSRLSA